MICLCMSQESTYIMHVSNRSRDISRLWHEFSCRLWAMLSDRGNYLQGLVDAGYIDVDKHVYAVVA